MSLDASSDVPSIPPETGEGGRPGRGRAALAGILAAAAALGVTELAAGLVSAVPSLIEAVGSVVIDVVPPTVKDLAIAVFGIYDKLALVVGTLLIAAACGAGVGMAAAHRLRWGGMGFAAFAVLGTLAATRDPQASSALAGIAAAVAAASGVLVLRALLACCGAGQRSTQPAEAEPMHSRGSRREFLRLAAGVATAAAVTAAGGRMLARRGAASVARARVRLPSPATPLPAPASATALDVEGITPLFTPNEDFFRIDTALSVPRVDPANWRLTVTGMVDRPLSLSLEDVLSMPHVESDITLVCVSNEVGGGLAGNARWTGVPLRHLLERAGVQLGATQIVGRSVDGWTSGFPTDAALDGRDAMVAVGMNGQPLPLRHGFPARLVVPGLYGYVSATKWLSQIELTTWEAFDAYWIPRGWSKEAPIKTQSRIDVPVGGASVPAGQVAVAGVAWAGLRGVEHVEVSVDEGVWQSARLAKELAAVTWRQWVFLWDAAPGRHTLRVRASDGAGEVQTGQRSAPAPDGATGYHTVTVDVV